jgi:hypothetical protein
MISSLFFPAPPTRRGFFCVSDARGLLIEKLLETDEDLVDVLGVSKIGHGIGYGIVIFQA